MRDGSSRCPSHKVQAWKPSVGAGKRTTGRKLQAQRAALFAREPLCRECLKGGVTVQAEIRDHIKPLAEGGSDADANIQPLCIPCSDSKTAGESARGRGGRFFGPRPPETGRFVGFLRAQVDGVGGVNDAAEQASVLASARGLG